MFVQRNGEGAISGAFSNRQEGFAEEYLALDNPELMAFLEAAQPLEL